MKWHAFQLTVINRVLPSHPKDSKRRPPLQYSLGTSTSRVQVVVEFFNVALDTMHCHC